MRGFPGRPDFPADLPCAKLAGRAVHCSVQCAPPVGYKRRRQGSITIPSPTMVHLTSCLLLVLSSMALASARAQDYDYEESASPAPGTDAHPLCECYNPFSGTRNGYRGNPDTLCDDKQGPGFCYVKCDGACRDESPTASSYRCKSTLACKAELGLDLNRG